MLEVISIILVGFVGGFFFSFIMDKAKQKTEDKISKEIEDIFKEINDLYAKNQEHNKRITEEINKEVKNEDVAKFFNDIGSGKPQ